MNILIRAINANEDVGRLFEGGKCTRVKADTFEIIPYPETEEISIRAKYSEERGTGSRGGTVDTVVRYLVLDLTKTDLQTLVDAAIKANLVSLPGLQSLFEARQSLEKGLSELGHSR